MGTLTPPSAVPQTGSAQYNGTLYTTNGKTGSANISVDFATASVNMGITISDAHPPSQSSISANGTGSLNGNKYGVYGQSYNYIFSADGGFYGPSAEETAGTFTLDYNGLVWKDTFEGTFGAKK